MLNQDALSGGILSNAFRGSLYTTMHYMASEDKLVAGMGNGSIRYTVCHLFVGFGHFIMFLTYIEISFLLFYWGKCIGDH